MRRCPRCATPPTIPCDVPSAHPKRHPLGTATGPSLRLAPDAARPEPGRLHLRQSRLLHRGLRESGRRRPRGMTAESGVRGKGARARGVMRPLLGDESLARSPRPAAGRPTRRRAKGKWRRCPGGDESSTALTADASVGVARPSCPTALHREGAPSAALTAIDREARREQEGQYRKGS